MRPWVAFLKPAGVTVVVLAVVVLVRLGDAVVYRWARGIHFTSPHIGYPEVIFTNAVLFLWYSLLPVCVVAGLHSPKRIGRELGLDRGFLPGMGYAFFFTTPMLIGYALGGRWTEQALPVVAINQLRAALREEIFYRAFFFGQLFRHARWGFFPAVGVNALLFAGGHLYQARSFAEGLGVWAVTLVGAVWFAWLFVEWEYNLWLPVGLHLFMNLWWALFSIDDTALSGAVVGELPRLLTVLGSIGWTLGRMRRRGPAAITRTDFWWRRGAVSS